MFMCLDNSWHGCLADFACESSAIFGEEFILIHLISLSVVTLLKTVYVFYSDTMAELSDLFVWLILPARILPLSVSTLIYVSVIESGLGESLWPPTSVP